MLKWISLFISILLLSPLNGCGANKKSKDRRRSDQGSGPDAPPSSQAPAPQPQGTVPVNPLTIVDKNFANKNFTGQIFSGVDLSDANFENSILIDTQFTNVSLREANLSNIDAKGAKFVSVNLSGANLRGANFRDYNSKSLTPFTTTFKNTSFQGAAIDGKTTMNLSVSDAVRQLKMVYSPELHIASNRISDIGGMPVNIEISEQGRNPLTKEEKARVIQYLNEFIRLDISPDPSGNFSRIFGGTNARDLIPYINDNIKYIIHERKSGEEDTIAANYGVQAWSQLYNQQFGFRYNVSRVDVNGRGVAIDRPDVGVVTLGPVFVHMSTNAVRLLTSILHEARHSHCERPPSQADLKRFLDDDQLPEDKSCNHLHAQCPNQHTLAGKLACDDHPLGSYAVSAIFLETLASRCSNCSETDRQFALLYEKEVKTRLLGGARL